MALINVTLNIPRQERETLQRIAVALEAIVVKINEPEPDDPQPAIDVLVARLAQSNTALAAEVAKILTPSTPHP